MADGWRASVVTGVVDGLLDRTVVLGYTKVGSALRKRWWPDDPAPAAMAGKRVLVTGATAGIGEAMARSFAELGATVHLLGRDEGRTRQAAGRIRAGVPGAVVIEEVCDVSDLAAVRDWTADLSGRIPALHAIVHNAGVMPESREESAQGHEITLAAHVLGPHLITERLLPLLQAAKEASVVFMSSGGMYAAPLRDDDIEYLEDDYSGVKAYARTKRMQVVLAQAWATVLAGSDIRVESMHPGWVRTPGVAKDLPTFNKVTAPLLRDATDGADTAVWLVATRPESRPGHFWHDRAQRPTTFGWQRSEDRAKVSHLLDQISELTDTPNDWPRFSS